MLRTSHKLYTAVRRHGLSPTARRAVEHAAYLHAHWRDGAFDRRWGTDTQPRIEAPRLDGGVHARGGYDYQAVTVGCFRRALAAVRVPTCDYDFVDIGAGKGRAMMLASDYRWRGIHGVELSARLVEVARRNFERFRRGSGRATHFDLRHGDALAYELPERPAVLFLYNPFGGQVLDGFLDRLEAHQRRHRADLWLAYCNPKHADRVRARPWLRAEQVHPHWAVYRAGATE